MRGHSDHDRSETQGYLLPLDFHVPFPAYALHNVNPKFSLRNDALEKGTSNPPSGATNPPEHRLLHLRGNLISKSYFIIFERQQEEVLKLEIFEESPTTERADFSPLNLCSG
ncbi:hypothetical protein VNO77_03715 [Canavalia gladiata]|uniref:Uncharacterized protein n=1 Tax=Canavalia gladiata TaxID=3824 RepID=A0AAN9N0V9_CANGL